MEIKPAEWGGPIIRTSMYLLREPCITRRCQRNADGTNRRALQEPGAEIILQRSLEPHLKLSERKRNESSSWLKGDFHPTLRCFEDFSVCLEVSVTCEEMEQSCWLALCSISPVAHQVNCRECPLHMDNVGWVDV